MVEKTHPGIGFLQLLLKNKAVDGQSPFLQGALDGVDKLLYVDRFDEVIIGAMA